MNKKILIIDDDEELCAELREILSDEGYEVRTAFNGREGAELLACEHYGALILDLKLPGLNGYQVLHKARQNTHCPRIIVLSGRPLGDTLLSEVTGHRDEEDQVLGLADEVMNKPVQIPQLLAKVHEYTR